VRYVGHLPRITVLKV